MIGFLYAFFISAAIIGGILLARRLRGEPPTYKRRFSDHRGRADSLLYPSTGFGVGMDSSGHHHYDHGHHSPDCSTHTDSGGGCPDGGGSN